MKILIGTRGSKLALTQTDSIIDLLKKQDPSLEFEVVVIKTLGDTKQNTKNAAIRDKQEWVEGLDTALLKKKIDIAVHSAKDVPIQIDPSSSILPLGLRADPHDVFIPQKDINCNLYDLPQGAKVGTASLRRAAQILNQRPDIEILPHRGNINTRIDNLYNKSELDGIILAQAGIARLGLQIENIQKLSQQEMLPPVNQGIVVGQFLSEREDLNQLLMQIVDQDLHTCFLAERYCIELLGANCHSAVGVFAETNQKTLHLQCKVLLPDGSKMIQAATTVNYRAPKKASEIIAEDLNQHGAGQIIEESNKLKAGWQSKSNV